MLVHSSFEIMTQQKMNMKRYHDLPGIIQELLSRDFIWYILENWKKDSLIGEPIYREKNLSKFGQNRLAPGRSGVSCSFFCLVILSNEVCIACTYLVHPNLVIVNVPVRPLLFTISNNSL